MAHYISLLFLATLLIALLIIYNTYAFDQTGKSTCKNYIFNTYTYVALMITTTSMLTILFKNVLDYEKITSLASIIVIFVMSLGSMIGVYVLPKEQQRVKYLLTAIFCASFAFMIGALWSYNLLNSQTLLTVLVAALALSASVSLLAYKFPEYITIKFITFSIVCVLLFFLIELCVFLFTNPSEKTVQLFTVLGIFVSLLVLVLKTKLLLIAEKACVVPDYPKEGVGIYVYIQDIFMRLLDLKGKRR